MLCCVCCFFFLRFLFLLLPTIHYCRTRVVHVCCAQISFNLKRRHLHWIGKTALRWQKKNETKRNEEKYQKRWAPFNRDCQCVCVVWVKQQWANRIPRLPTKDELFVCELYINGISSRSTLQLRFQMLCANVRACSCQPEWCLRVGARHSPQHFCHIHGMPVWGSIEVSNTKVISIANW